MMTMTNKALIAAAFLTLGAVACDRSDKASTTNTTSAAAPNEPSADPNRVTPVPMDQTMDSKDSGSASEGTVIVPARGPSMGPSQATGISGVNNRGSMSNSGTPMNGQTAPVTGPDATNNTAPGHIMFPPEKGPGTGQPNSNGSHNMGASGPVDRR